VPWFIPIIVMDTPFVRVWHKKDDEFFVPKATMIFDFSIRLHGSYQFQFDSYVCLLRESLKKYTYIANLAGIEWQITGTKYGINLVTDGYDEMQRVLLEKTLDQMINLEIDPMWFKILKECVCIINVVNFINLIEH
ncbi:Insulin-degrading enzyme, partial [Temnothorax longispinosus]